MSVPAGTYFAEQSSYSEGFSQMKEHSAAAQAGTIAQAFPGAIAVPPILGGTTWGTWPAAATSRAKRRGARAGRQPAAAPPPATSASHPGRRSQDASLRFLKDGLAMLYCSVALGRQCRGNPALRRPEPGTHSATGGLFHAVYDNDQARKRGPMPAAGLWGCCQSLKGRKDAGKLWRMATMPALDAWRACLRLRSQQALAAAMLLRAPPATSVYLGINLTAFLLPPSLHACAGLPHAPHPLQVKGVN